MRTKLRLFFAAILLFFLFAMSASAQNIGFTAQETSKTTCQCSPVSYEFRIRNTGNFTEIYSFETKPASKYVTFDKERVALLPNANSRVVMSILLPCEMKGALNLNAKAAAEKSRYTAQIPVGLNVLSCYDYSLSVLDYVNDTFVPAKDSYGLCENQTKALSVKIENLDSYTNTYRARLIGPDWISLNGNMVTLAENQGAVFELGISPPGLDGSFDAAIDFTSELGKISKRKTIGVSVKNCYIPRIAPELTELKIGYRAANKTATIANTGKKRATYLLTVDGPEWLTVTPAAVAVEPGSVESFTLNANPPEDAEEKVYTVKVTATTEIRNSYLKEIQVNLKKPNAIVVLAGRAYAFLKSNIYYILSGLILLASLIIVIAVARKRKPEKKPKKMAEAKKEPLLERKEPLLETGRKSPLAYIILFFILLAAAAAVLYYKAAPVHGFVNSLLKKIISPQESPVPPIEPLMDFKKAGALVLDFIILYKYYLFAGIIILAVFLLLLRRKREMPYPARQPKPEIKITKVEKRAEKRVEKREGAEKIKAAEKEAMEKREAKPSYAWLYGIIIIAALAVLSYLAYLKRNLLLNTIILAKGALMPYWIYITAGIVVLCALIVLIAARKRAGEPKDEKAIAEKKAAEEKAGEKPTLGWLRSLIGLVVFVLILAAIVFVIYLAIRYFVIPYLIYIALAFSFLIATLFFLWVLKSIKTKTSIEMAWDEATPNTELCLATDNKRFGFGELLIRPAARLDNVKLSMKKLFKQPTLLRASEKVYEYFELDKENLPGRDIKRAILRFKVDKKWLRKNNLEKEDIILKNYTNKWQNVNTAVIDSDETHVFYESELQKLSYFAIASKKAEKAEKAERAEEAMPEDEGGASIKWLVVLLLVLVIAGGVYLYGYFKAPEQPAQPEQKPILPEEFAEQVWNEDSEHKIDLNKHFLDPDGDMLKFTSTAPENIKVTIKDGVAVLKPKPNWYGTDYIVFMADDRRGGIVSTKRVTLIVRDVPEEPLPTKIRNWLTNAYLIFVTALGGYLQYVVYGILGLIILVLVIRYNKSIIDFFLEEDKEKKKEKKK